MLVVFLGGCTYAELSALRHLSASPASNGTRFLALKPKVCKCGGGWPEPFMYALYMTVYLVISLPKYRVYTVNTGLWPALRMCV